MPRPSSWAPPPWASRLDATIRVTAKRYPGKFAAYISDPHRGFRYGYHAEDAYYLASGVKLPFLIEVYRQVEMGQLSLDEEIFYGPNDIRDGAPRLNRKALGSKFSVRQLVLWMMQASDNAASDLLAKRVGLANVNRGLKALGIHGFTPLTYLIDVRRGFLRELDVRADELSPLQIRTIRWTPIWQPQLDRFAQFVGRPPGAFSRRQLFEAYERYYATNRNAAPMRAIGEIFEKLVFGELVSAKASREMLDIMRHARTSTHRLLGRLPRGTEVAHKTGSQFRRVCDLGVISLPDGLPLIVAMCTKDGPVKASEAAIARIARRAYDLAHRDHRRARRRAGRGKKRSQRTASHQERRERNG